MVPFPKISFNDSLRPAKYAILLLFVMVLPSMLPLFTGGSGDPWFCKAICPAGTSLAGWPLVSSNPDTFQLGFLFWWKSSLAVLILLWAVAVERPFCRSICPLGAVWGIMGKVSVIRMKVSSSCVSCGKCGTVCPMGIDIYKNSSSGECIRCGKCIQVCPVNAISHSAGR